MLRNPRHLIASLSGLALCSGIPAAHATVTQNPLFADHAVLQQGAPVPIWGTAEPGEAVTVEMAGQRVTASAGRDGKWLARLSPMEAGGPHTLVIAGKNRIVLRDVLVGEVWLASGQSNMERQLGLRDGQRPLADWEKEVAAARYPQIHHFTVARANSLVPLPAVNGQWEVCTPETVKDFSAVGYFFGRDLHRARKVPVGIIHSSWGGTPAEAWTSEAGLRPLPDFATTASDLKLLKMDPETARREQEARLEAWFAQSDPSSAPGKPAWHDPALDTSAWKTLKVPGLWEESGETELANFDGVVWLRKTFDLPAGKAKLPAELRLAMIDDVDTTWLNGVKLGMTTRYDHVRKYAVPAAALRPGRNVLAVRVLDTGGGGGIWGNKQVELAFAGEAMAVIDLSGPWQYRIGMNLKDGPMPPASMVGDVETPTVLWNGMIAPLLPYAIRGVIWYQGEANVHRAGQYRTLFPALIADWRRAFGQGDFPFLFVQIAPFRDMTPEIREAQLLSLQRTRNTAMAVTLDCGDANDIHPTRKQPVGARLALAARVLAYGEALEYSGPIFASMTIDGRQAALRFTHVAKGLSAKGGPLLGFTIAGADKVFHPARAEIRGQTVVVTSPAVPKPVAVRYGWANVPKGNLWNKAGLPASPFRTDVD